MTEKNDNVKELPHYMSMTIQPIRYFHASMTPEAFKGFLKGNIIKYLMRENMKNGIEDVHKAKVYMDWLNEFVDTGDITVPGEGE